VIGHRQEHDANLFAGMRMAVDVHLRSKCHEEEAKRIPNDHFRPQRKERFVRKLYEVLKVHKKT
jgi:hypothetical protein